MTAWRTQIEAPFRPGDRVRIREGDGSLGPCPRYAGRVLVVAACNRARGATPSGWTVHVHESPPPRWPRGMSSAWWELAD